MSVETKNRYIEAVGRRKTAIAVFVSHQVLKVLL